MYYLTLIMVAWLVAIFTVAFVPIVCLLALAVVVLCECVRNWNVFFNIILYRFWIMLHLFLKFSLFNYWLVISFFLRAFLLSNVSNKSVGNKAENGKNGEFRFVYLLIFINATRCEWKFLVVFMIVISSVSVQRRRRRRINLKFTFIKSRYRL